MRLKTVVFLPAHLVEVHGLYLQATAVLESRHLSEQFELNMQLLGMDAYPEQRICCLYRGQFAPAASKFYRGANGYWEDLRLSINAFGQNLQAHSCECPN